MESDDNRILALRSCNGDNKKRTVAVKTPYVTNGQPLSSSGHEQNSLIQIKVA